MSSLRILSKSVRPRTTINLTTPSYNIITRSYTSVPTTTQQQQQKTTSPTETQAPNRLKTWSENQAPRSVAMSGPRFEQTDLEKQPQPLAAIDLVSQEPIRMVPGRYTWCDGGGGALGHPKVYINLDKPGPQGCSYCSILYQQEPHHH